MHLSWLWLRLFPAAQAEHVLDFLSNMKPGLQELHDDAPGSEYLPGEQGVHSLCPPNENVLASHFLHSVLSAFGAVPAGQRSQKEDPFEGAMDPLSQGMHFAVTEELLYFPGAHFLHSLP